jgi:uncharacterized membrane protein YphA (DoxX/SURF4 family)
MFVAFFTAGKSALLGDGEMVFAYAIVMLTIVLTGAGKVSLDYYFFGRRRYDFVVTYRNSDNVKKKLP